MSEPAAAADRTWGKTRVEALSDGVFAIVMTLLVLDIRTPDLPRPVASSALLHALAALGPTLASFAITFGLAGSFWFMHHVSFHNVRYVTRTLCTVNLLFLMFVSLLPFSTAMLGRFGLAHPVALAVYFANQLALGLVLNAHWIYARRRGLLVSPMHDRASRFMIAVQPLACALAIATALVRPHFSFYAFAFTMMAGRRIAGHRFKTRGALEPAPL